MLPEGLKEEMRRRSSMFGQEKSYIPNFESDIFRFVLWSVVNNLYSVSNLAN